MQKLSELLAAWSAAVHETHHPQPPAYDGPDVSISYFTEKSGDVVAKTQSAVVLEKLISQFMFNKASEGSDKQ